ncbi:MAG TPA: hypothetical protein VII22_18245, partial [Streptosporangiaceae bacterium]
MRSQPSPVSKVSSSYLPCSRPAAPKAGNAADRVQELALDERPALDLQAQRHEEGGHDVEICDREADVAEASY